MAAAGHPQSMVAARRPGRQQLRARRGAVRAAGEAAGAAGANVLHLMVEGVHCGACVRKIERSLEREGGLETARVNLTTRRLTVRWHGDPGRANRLARVVAELGYGVVPFDPDRLRSLDHRTERELLRCLAVAGFAASNVMLLSVSIWAGDVYAMGAATRTFLHWFEALIALPAIAYAGRPFFGSAWRALRAGHTNMDVPISLGVILAPAMSVVETVARGRARLFRQRRDPAVLPADRPLPRPARAGVRPVGGGAAAGADRLGGDAGAAGRDHPQRPAGTGRGRAGRAGRERRAGRCRRRRDRRRRRARHQPDHRRDRAAARGRGRPGVRRHDQSRAGPAAAGARGRRRDAAGRDRAADGAGRAAPLAVRGDRRPGGARLRAGRPQPGAADLPGLDAVRRGTLVTRRCSTPSPS